MIACPSDRLCHLPDMPCALLALSDHWPELRLLASKGTSAVHYNTPRGFPNSSPIFDSFVKLHPLQLPNIKAAIHHIWTSVYKQYPTEEYGQAAVWTIAKQTIATFILDFQRQCEEGTHPIQDIKNQIKIAHSETDTQKPTQARIDNIKALEDKLQKTIQAQRKSATAAANKAAHAESQAKQFYKKYRPSLKGGGIASLHTTPNWDDPETKGDPSDKTEDMCKEAANYYMWMWLFLSRKTSQRAGTTNRY
eukprot:scaffold5586_cov124-Isochrysis_galbana.AAC.19